VNWNKVRKFYFTWAIPEQLAQIWIDRQLERTGWMTGQRKEMK
jgi:hypothetical protein